MMKEDLAQLRAQLDALDDALAALLVRRARLSVRVGELKRLSGGPVRRPEREAEILARLGGLVAQQDSPLTRAQLERIYQAVFAVSRQLQAGD
jgi:chorismate mutase/prephenate dehydratase